MNESKLGITRIDRRSQWYARGGDRKHAEIVDLVEASRLTYTQPVLVMQKEKAA